MGGKQHLSRGHKNMKITLEPKKIAIAFFSIVVFLTVVNIIGLFFTYYLGHSHVFGLVQLFDLDKESNIPTLYSSIALFFCSVLLSIIAISRRKSGDTDYPYWFGLAIIFIFLSIDESVCLHERLTVVFREYLETSGILYYAWVIPYGIALILFILIYIKYIANLPKRTMILFIVSGAIYVSGAIGFESLGGVMAELHGEHNITFGVLYTCEEFCEMLGVVVFIYALLSYLYTEMGYLPIIITLQRRLPLRHSGESRNPIITIWKMAILVHGHRSISGCRIKSGMTESRI